MSEEEKEIVAETAPALTAALVSGGLSVIGKHPILLNHTYLELAVKGQGVADISLLAQYPNLMYVDMTENAIESIVALQNLPTLVQLNLSKNKLTKCLDFSLAQCTSDNAWSQGDTCIGSMLTNANLSFNSITSLSASGLANHPFLEVLLLSNNCIESIDALSGLKYLRVLDLSNNKLSNCQGLQEMHVSELNLAGNAISDLAGLESCVKLSSLNVSRNKLRTLATLQKCPQLMNLNACDNKIEYIRQCDFLSGLEWMSVVLLMGNPCSNKQFYRRRVINKLPRLSRLDASDVTAEEQVETANLFHTELNDIEGRKQNFHKHFPREDFAVPAPLQDDEAAITDEELAAI